MIFEIFKTIIATLSFFANKYFSIKIVEHFTPIHLIFSFPVYFFIQKLVLIISTIIKEQTFSVKIILI